MIRYYQAETQNLARGAGGQGRSRSPRRSRPSSASSRTRSSATGARTSILLDRQIELARAGLARPRSRPRSAAGSSRSWPTPARSPAGRCSAWATSRHGRDRRGLPGRRAPAEAGRPGAVQVLDQAVAGKVTPHRLGRGQEPACEPRPQGPAGPSRREGHDPPGRPEPARRFVNMEVDVAIRPSAGSGRGDVGRGQRQVTDASSGTWRTSSTWRPSGLDFEHRPWPCATWSTAAGGPGRDRGRRLLAHHGPAPARLPRSRQDHGGEQLTSSSTSTWCCSRPGTSSSTPPGSFPLERLPGRSVAEPWSRPLPC